MDNFVVNLRPGPVGHSAVLIFYRVLFVVGSCILWGAATDVSADISVDTLGKKSFISSTIDDIAT